MAVENEMVRFIAEMDLDPQDVATFTAGLKSSEEQCASLRKAISDTTNQMAKLRAEGKENSEEFDQLSKEQKTLTTELKKATKEANSYSAALSTNQMSIKQLQQHARSLRSALNSMHKEADPALWQKYTKELQATEKRMVQLQSEMKGVGQSANILTAIRDVLISVPGATQLVTAAINVAKKGFVAFTEQTQEWGDKWAVVVASATAGWNQLIANIKQGTSVAKAGVLEMMQAAAEAQRLRDELFERENSASIREIELRTEINELQAVVNDRSYSAQERLDALEQIKAKETEIADTRKSIAAQELEAAKLTLKTRMQLSDEELESIIDEYETNRDLIKRGQEYNALIKERNDQLAEQRKLGMGEGVNLMSDTVRSQISLIDEALQDFTEEEVSYAREVVAQYQLGNDEMVADYVNAKKKMLSADTALTAAIAAQARRRGTLEAQLASEMAADAEKAYQARLSTADAAYTAEANALKAACASKEISETEYQVKLSALELTWLNERKAVMESYGKDVGEITTQIYDKQMEAQNKLQQAFSDNAAAFSKEWSKITADTDAAVQRLLDEMEAEVNASADSITAGDTAELQRLISKSKESSASKSSRLESAQNNYDSEMADLEAMHDLKLISEEEFLAKKEELTREYAERVTEIETETWQNGLSTTSSILDKMSSAISAAQSAEYAAIEAWKEKELTAAGDDAEKREEIEAEAAEKELEIEKKYANIDMGINIAKTIAAGALAVMQSYAQLGPIAGAVMAGVITALTAAQVATIVAQRNAIMNSSTDSSSTSSTSTTGGYSEGGYTGNGGRTEVAGVVHKGEYVVPQPEMRDPYVRSVVASIEARRRQRTSKNALPGFAEGGYTDSAEASISRDTVLLEKLLESLDDLKKSPLKAYTVLSDFEATQTLRDKFRNTTSLRR